MGDAWTAVGYNAGYSNNTGNNWTAVGYTAGYGNQEDRGRIMEGKRTRSEIMESLEKRRIKHLKNKCEIWCKV